MKKSLIIALVLSLTNLLFGEVFYVSTTGSDSNDGKSWETAFADVQTAIDAAYATASTGNPNEVWIAGGIYKHGSSLKMRNNVEIYGSFSGNEKSKEERTFVDRTILSGEEKYGVISNDYTNDQRLTQTSKLDSVELSGGNAVSGGGIYNYYASPVITNTTIDSNTASEYGGGICNMRAAPTFKNVTITNNNGDWGGGSYNDYLTLGAPVYINCTIAYNKSGSHKSSGIYSGAYYEAATLINCTITKNSNNAVATNAAKGQIIKNCIIYDNENKSINDEGPWSSGIVVSNSIVQGSYTGENNIDTDPLLEELDYYGGIVKTFKIKEGSPAIGYGKLDSDIPTTDARGVARENPCTIGAYEYTENPARNIYYVSVNGSNENDGSSWKTAFADVQVAIDAAAEVASEDSPSEIWIAEGTYKHGAPLKMRNYVEIYGGFSGTEKSKSERGICTKTILSGENAYRVFFNEYTSTSPLNTSAVIDTVTIANGLTVSDTSTYGGAMYNKYASPTIRNCYFYNNTAKNTQDRYEIGGGAIYCINSSIEVLNCYFEKNTSSAYWENSLGGAIFCDGVSNSSIVNSTFFDNTALSRENARGGAIATRLKDGSTINVINCTFLKNSTSAGGYSNGGAIDSENATKSSLTILNSIFDNNSNNGLLKNGSAICCSKIGSTTSVSVSNISNCIFNNNEIFGSYTGENITKADPMLEQVGFYGGLVQTIPVSMNSPAIAMGINNDMTPNSDARGKLRNAPCTIGAYEYVPNAGISASLLADVVYVEEGDYAYFEVETDISDPSYIWFFSIDNGNTWTEISGEVNPILSFPVDSAMSGFLFKCAVSNGNKIVETESAVLVVNIKTYTLTVENGSGGGTVASGDTVQIVADAPADGMVFDKWVGDVETVADVSASTTTIKMPAKNATVTATYVEKPVVDPFGDAVVYPNVAMTILGEVDLFGSPANSGCVVAAYVGNELRGKSSVVDISGRSLVNLTVNVNANGEEIKFKIWTPSDGKIIDARADCTAVSASGDSLGSLDSPFAIVFANDLNLELLLKEGWNQVSFNVGLENMAVRTILSDVIDSVALVQGSGTSFNPSWPDSLNTLKSFDNTSGFWVKMNAAASVSLTGSALDVSAKTISLKAGWNNIGYTPATAASIRTVLATALADGKIERIINSKGNFNPATPDVLNSLKTMTPGEGYWVKANAATTIAYDKITTATLSSRKSRAVIFAANSTSENFGEPVVYPNVQMTILADVLVNGAAAPSGSVVAAFVDGELRAKQEIVSLDGKSIANLTVSVAKNGETIGFKIWNSATGETLDFATTVAAESGAAPYTYPDNLLELSTSGTPSIGGDTEPADPVVYPNTPMSLYVEVQIDGKTVSDGDIVAAYVGDELRGKQTVVIYGGKAIANLVVNVASNGEKIAFKVWDASAKRLYTATTTINAEIGGEPYSYPDNLLIVNAQTATGGFALWTSKNGLSGDNANAMATPFNDGITNIEKFAFGLSGNKAASYSENALFKQSYADGKASFQFPINKDAADSVNVKVMTSEDLVNWAEAPSSNIGESGDFNLMQTEQTVPEGGKLFFKLIVEEK